MSEADSIFRNRKPPGRAQAHGTAPRRSAELPTPGADAPREQVFEYAALLALLHAYGGPGVVQPPIVDQARRLYLERWGEREPELGRERKG